MQQQQTFDFSKQQGIYLLAEWLFTSNKLLFAPGFKVLVSFKLHF